MLKRTKLCTEVKEKDIDKTMVVCGWVHSWRDHGGVIFIDLRDYTGIIQVVFNPEISKECHDVAGKLRSEDVIAVKGIVSKRSDETINPKIPTGMIEVKVNEVELLNKSLTPPFEIDDQVNVGEEHRLQYRYLDMRRNQIQHNIRMRHEVVKEFRNFLNDNHFLDIETPIMNKSTPEGARDFLVPSRVNPGKFYALPQSPQIFKQILMVAGFDKYYQIVRCFRDEDLRKDRQPEFTQIDMEMSFIDEEDIYGVVEEMFRTVIKKVFHKNVKTPFPRYTYREVMDKYGLDKPDLRYALELTDITDLAGKTDFMVFKETVEKKGIVKCLNVPGGAKLSRKEIDDLTSFVSIFGAKGLAWIKITDKGPESVVVKFIPEPVMKEIMDRAKSRKGDVLFFMADQPQVVYDSLGNLRNKLAEIFKLIDEDQLNFLWVHNFPLMEYDKVENRLTAIHHPFTHPKRALDDIGSEKDLIKTLKENPQDLFARSYDLVLNGIELGGGSIRIHHRKLQEETFSALGLKEEQMKDQFGFLLDALSYGAPPHGGIAFGLDRFLMLLLKQGSIRDVIPFPKTQKAVCLMSDSPSEVSEKQLKELSIKLDILKADPDQRS
ncbi:MAG: aspartate--tRNA ligase [Spirochaetes bacterium]|nr:aspartate--tRNA ligase [Spirochaetota bacterium]